MNLTRKTKRTTKVLANQIKVDDFGLVFASNIGQAHIRIKTDAGEIYELTMYLDEARKLGNRLAALELPEGYLNA